MEVPTTNLQTSLPCLAAKAGAWWGGEEKDVLVKRSEVALCEERAPFLALGDDLRRAFETTHYRVDLAPAWERRTEVSTWVATFSIPSSVGRWCVRWVTRGWAIPGSGPT